MRKIRVVALSMIASLLVFSCGKEEVGPYEIPDEFSELTVEQNKENLEANGIELIRDMEELKNVQGLDAGANLLNLMEYMDNANLRKSPGFSILSTLQRMQEGKATAKDVFSSLRLNGPVPSGEPASIQEFFDIYAGTYSWKAASQEWNYTTGGTSLIFEFPSVEGKNSNDAVLTIGDYKGVTIANPIDEEYAGDLPTHLTIDMTVSGIKVLGYSFTASYNEAGEPKSLTTSLTLAPYTFAVQLDNTTTEAGFAYSLKRDKKELIALNASVTGDFSTGNMETKDAEDVINQANASFQLLNIKTVGTIDAKNLMAEMNKITAEGDARVAKEVELLNKYYDLVVFYVDKQVKIAETEFYTTRRTEYVYDEYGQIVDVVEVSSAGIRLVFKDGSKADFETYFGSGFEDLIEELNSFITE